MNKSKLKATFFYNNCVNFTFCDAHAVAITAGQVTESVLTSEVEEEEAIDGGKNENDADE